MSAGLGRAADHPSAFGAMAAIGAVTIRALAGRRRTLLMLLLAGAPVLLGILVRLGSGHARPTALVPTLEGLVVTTVLPLVALVFGTAALGSELDDGTAVHILTKPIPRWTIIVPKLVVAGGLTTCLLVPSTILCGIFLGGAGSREIAVTVAFAIGVALAGLAGALLAPLFLNYPTNGVVTTVKGFEIIVIGGLGSIPGALIGVALLGLLPEVMRTTMRGLLIWQELVYGLILIGAVMFMPRGIWGFIAGRRGSR